MKSASSLKRLQVWMQSELTRSQPSSDRAIARVVLPSPSLTSSERLGLYAGMLQLRYADCLRQDFPGVAHAVGAERFNALCNAYVERHPSRHYSLNMLGARFADFLRDEAGLRKHRVFLSELAQLERAVQESFDSAPSTVLRAEELLTVPQHAYAALRLTLAPGALLLETSYPVDQYLQGVFDQRSPGIPARKRSWTLVYRRDFVVWRARIDRVRFTLLQALRDGATLGKALDACTKLPRVDARKVGPSISTWFDEWAAAGVFAGPS